MRILMLNYEFPPIGGGGGAASYKLAKGFVRAGYKVDCITSLYKGLKKFEVINGINIYRVKIIGRKDLSVATFFSMFSYLLSGFWRGLKLNRKNKYEFINTQFVIPTGPLGYLLSKILKAKNILSIHGGDIYDPSKNSSPHQHWYLRVAVKFLLNRSDQVVAQSSNTKENIIKYYKIKKKIKIIPLPYELFNFRKINRKVLDLYEDKQYLISIGRLIKRKGFEYLIKASALLDDNVELLIIGDGPEKESLLKLTKELKMQKRVHFLGFISEEKKFQYLNNADIYVLSSLHEGFGICLQEAMQVGLPIVATNNGGQVDFIEDKKNGLLAKHENSKKLAKKIEELLNNKKLRKKMSEQNIQDINKFNLDNIVKQYINLTK